MKIKIIPLTDADPWHVSAVPFFVMVAGIVLFVIGAAPLCWGDRNWWWFAVLILGGLTAAIGLACMGEERADLDAIEAAEERKRNEAGA